MSALAFALHHAQKDNPGLGPGPLLLRTSIGPAAMPDSVNSSRSSSRCSGMRPATSASKAASHTCVSSVAMPDGQLDGLLMSQQCALALDNTFHLRSAVDSIVREHGMLPDAPI